MAPTISTKRIAMHFQDSNMMRLDDLGIAYNVCYAYVSDFRVCRILSESFRGAEVVSMVYPFQIASMTFMRSMLTKRSPLLAFEDRASKTFPVMVSIKQTPSLASIVFSQNTCSHPRLTVLSVIQHVPYILLC